jgi:hypothetical protein
MEGLWQSFESQVFVDELHTVFYSIEEFAYPLCEMPL